MTILRLLKLLVVFIGIRYGLRYIIGLIYLNNTDEASMSVYNFINQLSFWSAIFITLLLVAKYLYESSNGDKTMKKDDIFSWLSYLIEKFRFNYLIDNKDGNGLELLIDRYQSDGKVTIRRGSNRKTIAYFKKLILVVDKKGQSVLLSQEDIDQIIKWRNEQNI